MNGAVENIRIMTFAPHGTEINETPNEGGDAALTEDFSLRMALQGQVWPRAGISLFKFGHLHDISWFTG
jgi:hypothetical protein